MDARDSRHPAGRRSGGSRARPRRSALAALLSIAFLCSLCGSVAAADAAPTGAAGPGSTQFLLARMAVQQAQLSVPGGASGDLFGNAVAISGDTALVGAPSRALTGTAYVFVRTGGVWTQQATLTAADGAEGDWFGASVALSGDTALVGAPVHRVGAIGGSGAAYVFVRSGSVWTRQAELTAADAAVLDCFGDSVALSGDTAVVGAPQLSGGAGRPGAAYVFARFGGVWTQQARLTAADGAGHDNFGGAVAVSGETALVGAADHATSVALDAGAAYVYVRSGTVWTAQAELFAADGGVAAEFGYSVALSGDTALIGEPRDNRTGATNAGSAYVFVRAGGVWTLDSKLLALDGSAYDQFGYSVALADDTALIGAPMHEGAPAGVYTFSRAGGSWGQQARLTAADGTTRDSFGFAVAMSGATLLIGAPGHSLGGVNCGVAYTFLDGPTVTSFDPLSGSAGTPVTLTGAGFTGATGVEFNGSPATSYAVDSDAQITATVPAGATSGPITVLHPGGIGVSPTDFTVTAGPTTPAIAGFWPGSGWAGSEVTVTGTGFTGATAVTFDGSPAAGFTVGSDTKLWATVPAGASSGPIAVTSLGGTGHSVQTFIVLTAPKITRLTPASGKRRAVVTIRGGGFGAVRAGGYVRFGTVKSAGYLSWSESQITCRVPAKAKYGTVKVRVTTADGVSNAKSFKVKR